MKTLKLLLLALTITLSSFSYAHDSEKFADEVSMATEISKLLKERTCEYQKNFKVTVFFSVSEDMKTQEVNVASPNEEINQMLEEKLSGQELEGASWKEGKVYELSVVVKPQTV